MQVTDSLIANNTAAVTSAIFSTTGGTGGGVDGGSVTLDGSAIRNNTVSFASNRVGTSGALVSGGGINATQVGATGSTVANNIATGGGFGTVGFGLVALGIGLDATDQTLNRTTVSGNHAVGIPQIVFVTIVGEGLIAPGSLTALNSTITDNTGSTISEFAAGAGVVATNPKLVYSTITNNGDRNPLSTDPGANLEIGGTAQSFAAVITQPAGGPNCTYQTGATLSSQGYNFSNDSTCNLASTGDRQGAGNPALGALANNGGPTQTLLPATGSPLIDSIPNGACQTPPLASGITTDQRSLSRPSPTGGACDIGAVEVQTSAPAAVVITPRFTG